MFREYVRWFSPALQKDMEMLVFGTSGASVLFFPARMGRFYDYENWNVIEALRTKIESGHLQVFCVDSNDCESFYSQHQSPEIKMRRHLDYENYIVKEVISYVHTKNPNSFMIAAGCSLGAYHALNTALKHPTVFKKVVAMSGRYDLTQHVSHYNDLLDGYWNETVYFNMPLQYVPNLNEPIVLAQLSTIEVVLVIGRDDVLFPSNEWLAKSLSAKGINTTLHVWDKEAHRAKAWRKMVEVYL